ncbi:hypothetical protein RYZ26_14945 [Terasakiella sp. A23]|uniref:hypothetical protein n=1 Tax=Terasakiella sp. FCG-A23 TaxID=3080561 RepID=UPI00295570B8|nr:hypothetical protein [Terasakiella sp. A23]MDV7340902.1 hypothetical protein [Terasakiella sp. A23]
MSKQEEQSRPIALVRGVSDVGSAISWKLFHAGFIVINHENRQPRTIRRKMAFCDALWTGEAELEGLRAVRVERLDDVLKLANLRKAIALYAGQLDGLITNVKPDLIVDARIQKFAKVEPLKGKAPLTIAVGPSFIAGEDVDRVIESCWGEDLGRVISDGSAVDPVPVPPRLNGIGWERFVRSEIPGRFESDLSIGAYVEKGAVIGQLDGTNVLAGISGYLRGLLHPGLSVLKGEKLCEIDPRDNEAHFIGLAERPAAIGDGVLKAIAAFSKEDETIENLKGLKFQCDSGILANNAEMG